MIIAQVCIASITLRTPRSSSMSIQLALLYICIIYRPKIAPESLGTSTRPFAFWQWSTYTQYIEFLAGFVYVMSLPSPGASVHRSPRLLQAILFLIFGRSDIFVSILGFVALGLESTLPIPQLIRQAKYTSIHIRSSDIPSAISRPSLSMVSVCPH